VWTIDNGAQRSASTYRPKPTTCKPTPSSHHGSRTNAHHADSRQPPPSDGKRSAAPFMKYSPTVSDVLAMMASSDAAWTVIADVEARV